jgi:hypothetical protein
VAAFAPRRCLKDDIASKSFEWLWLDRAGDIGRSTILAQPPDDRAMGASWAVQQHLQLLDLRLLGHKADFGCEGASHVLSWRVGVGGKQSEIGIVENIRIVEARRLAVDWQRMLGYDVTYIIEMIPFIRRSPRLNILAGAGASVRDMPVSVKNACSTVWGCRPLVTRCRYAEAPGNHN